MGERRGLREPRGPSHKFHPVPSSEQKLFFPRLEWSFRSGTGLAPEHRQGKPGRARTGSEGGKLRYQTERQTLPQRTLTDHRSFEAISQDQGKKCSCV